MGSIAPTLRALVIAASCSVASAQETPLSFGPFLWDPMPAPFFPTMFRTADLDGDGFVDLVIAGRDPDDRLITRRGDGTGRFLDAQVLAAPGFIDWLELADLDGDGMRDIVAAWRGDFPRLVMYRAIGGGLFDEAVVLADVEIAGVGRDPQSVAPADLDGDGDLDIAVCNYIGQSIDVFTNEGVREGIPVFAKGDRVRLATFLDGVAFPRIVATGDLDGDGDLDLVANEVGGSRVAVVLNEGGRFVGAVEYRVPIIGSERPGISGLELADIDGDGDLDAFCPALLLEQAQKVVAFINDGSGRFVDRVVGEGSPLGYAFSAHLADFDGDGDLDAVSGAALPGTIAVTRRTDGGLFAFAVDAIYPFGQLIRHLDAVDVDGDCDLDVVGIDGPARAVFTYINTTPQRDCGGIASVDARPRRAPVPVPALSREPVPMVDINRDGVVDATDIAVWLGQRSQAGGGGAR